MQASDSVNVQQALFKQRTHQNKTESLPKNWGRTAMLGNLKLFSSFCVTCFESTPTPGNSMNGWHPQSPVLHSAARLLYIHTCGLFYGVNPSYIWSFSLPPIFSSIIAFSKKKLCLPMICPKHHSFSWVIFSSSDVLGIICSRARLFIFWWFRSSLGALF